MNFTIRWRLAAGLCLGAFAWLVGGCAQTPSGSRAPAPAGVREPLTFAVGADVSFLAQAEERGTIFKDGGVAKPGLQIFKDRGYTWVRLRLFHTPSNHRTALPNDLPYTIALAQRAKALGFKILLDFHYSDTWADPAKQFIPQAWEGQTPAQLVESVFVYTRDTLAAFREAGVLPDMVQNGNEITYGMLWPAGKVPEQWDAFAELVRAGIRGVEAGAAPSPRPLILVQIERGGDREGTKYFFDNLFARGVTCDVLGQSFYPWWHGSITDLRETLRFMAETYRKPIMVVETAYCWRPTEYRDKPAPFPETPEGQRAFLQAVADEVRAVPGGLGVGVFWWEPAVPMRSGNRSGGLRSRGMFDDAGNALPVIEVFSPAAAGSGLGK